MSKALNFRIGAIGIGFTGKSNWQYTDNALMTSFFSTQPPNVNYQINTNPLPIEPSSRPIFSTGNGWRLYQYSNRWVVWVPSLRPTPYLVGNFSQDFHSGEIFASESDQEPGKFIFPISYPMGELLMISLLGTGYGLMLHSCGVIDGGNGMAFAGTSTAGKTTTARLWNYQAGARVINDDHTILRKVDGQFRVYGTPWHSPGGFALAEDAPLKKIFILKHAQSNQAFRLSPSQAVAALLVRTFAPLWDARAMAFTLQFLDELCQAVPCYELGFVPDQSAVEYVKCLSSD